MATSPLDVPVDIVRRTMETNVFGAFRLIRALAPMMRDGGYGRIVNVSSRRGQFAAMYPPGGHPAYRASKAVLNVYTFIFHIELKDTNVLVNAVDPGWMRTDMGGPHADRSGGGSGGGPGLAGDPARRRAERRVLPRPRARPLVIPKVIMADSIRAFAAIRLMQVRPYWTVVRGLPPTPAWSVAPNPLT